MTTGMADSTPALRDGVAHPLMCAPACRPAAPAAQAEEKLREAAGAPALLATTCTVALTPRACLPGLQRQRSKLQEVLKKVIGDAQAAGELLFPPSFHCFCCSEKS